jgi:hypothetical protein
MTQNISTNPVRKKVIYIYKHTDEYKKHIGWLKIGDQTGLNSTRIQEQNEADNVETETLFQIPAVDIYGNSFRDHDIHKALEVKGYEREVKVNTDSNRLSEWFKVDLETVKRVIDDRINCRDIFAGNVPTTSQAIVLRDEQKAAIEKTYAYWSNPINAKRSFLWNAKPRFGKTLTSYFFVKEIKARRVLIVTNRPAISDSWFKDFHAHMRAELPDHIFAASKAIELRDSTTGNQIAKSLTRDDLTKNQTLLEKPLIFFISLQDIKGKSKQAEEEFKHKNQWLFDSKIKPWDLVIVDESHEGASTIKAKEVFKNLNTKFTLHLSGTPFKIIADGKFDTDQIYNWSYADEQHEKQNWDYEKGANPYEELPKMNIFTYSLSDVMKGEAGFGELAFDLKEFFDLTDNHFTYAREVETWLDNLTGISRSPETGEIVADSRPNKNPLPFDTEGKRDQLRHTFWLLPGVKECKAMKRVLNSHPIFGKDGENYAVVLAAGKGDDEHDGKTILSRVQQAITDKPYETKTITLSCGQLTTGITVPEWTAVFMLYGAGSLSDGVTRSSSTKYLQAAFRAQNPWKYKVGAEETYKTDCFVFDFAPDRVLTIIQDYAISLASSTMGEHKKSIRKLLNFLPVIAVDENGQMRELNAEDVVELPMKLTAKEIVDGRFIASNKIFANIGNIFHAPAEVREIINKMEAVKKGKVERVKTDVPEPETEIDDAGNTIIDPDITVATTEGVLGKKEYEVLTDDEQEMVKDLVNDKKDLPNDDTPSENKSLIEKAAKEIKQKSKKTAEDKQHEEENAFRDKLRGFARAIPMFLHAYGTPNTDLMNFEQNIPNETFVELTNITKEEFRTLRDTCKFFNELAFNAAVKYFVRMEQALANYFVAESNEDIFDYIPPQENNQIFTPKKVVGEMLDMLEQNDPTIFHNPNLKFFDPDAKSGLFMSGITKRLYAGLKHKIPNDRERLEHILTKQIYTWSPTDILRHITKNTITSFTRWSKTDYDKKLIRACEDNFVQYDPLDNKERKINYEEIKAKIRNDWGQEMKFDVVIGNPPYQQNLSDNKMSRSIYQTFVEMADIVANKICFIIPARWMGGETGPYNELRGFVAEMKEGQHIKEFHDFPNSQEVFNGVDIKGGVCFFIKDKNYIGDVKYVIHEGEKTTEIERSFDNKLNNDIIIRFAELDAVVKKIDYREDTMKTMVSSWNPYGFISDLFTKNNERVRLSEKPLADDDWMIYGLFRSKRTIRYIPHDALHKNHRGAKKYKVFLPRANGSGAFGEVFSTPILGLPIQICTDTFLQVGEFTEEQEATALLQYIKSKFFRALVGVKKIAVFNYKDAFQFVPIQNFTAKSDIDWAKSIPEIDQQLYKKYHLTDEEINFIETRVKEMK